MYESNEHTKYNWFDFCDNTFPIEMNRYCKSVNKDAVSLVYTVDYTDNRVIKSGLLKVCLLDKVVYTWGQMYDIFL